MANLLLALCQLYRADAGGHGLEGRAVHTPLCEEVHLRWVIMLA